jgi:uncharacterized membrane protein YfcA
MSFIAALLTLGLVSGFLAGLLGVGGGLVMVPVLVVLFAQQGFEPAWHMHLALGTSLAVIVLTSISSLRAHHAHGAVRWQTVRRIAPGIVLGTLLGALAARHFSDLGLRLFFVAFLFYAATQMWLDLKPRAHRELPDWLGMTVAGAVIGAVSSWVGIGGGTLSVPFQLWCNVKLHDAIGTSAAIGFPIAVAGAVGYALVGLGIPGLPAWSVGFVYLPALAGIAVASWMTAPLGARLAHRLPVKRLKRIFALLLYVLALRMAYGLLI